MPAKPGRPSRHARRGASPARTRASAKPRRKRPDAGEGRSSRSPRSRRHDEAVAVDAARKRELRLIAHLFLISAITMALVILYLFAHELKVAFPAIVIWLWIGVMLAGWAASWIFGSWITWRYRRWWWFALAVFPFTTVPAAVAYAWNRRMEIEHEVFGD